MKFIERITETVLNFVFDVRDWRKDRAFYLGRPIREIKIELTGDNVCPNRGLVDESIDMLGAHQEAIKFAGNHFWGWWKLTEKGYMTRIRGPMGHRAKECSFLTLDVWHHFRGILALKRIADGKVKDDGIYHMILEKGLENCPDTSLIGIHWASGEPDYIGLDKHGFYLASLKEDWRLKNTTNLPAEAQAA
jgi:hypothetical protein